MVLGLKDDELKLVKNTDSPNKLIFDQLEPSPISSTPVPSAPLPSTYDDQWFRQRADGPFDKYTDDMKQNLKRMRNGKGHHFWRDQACDA